MKNRQIPSFSTTEKNIIDLIISMSNDVTNITKFRKAFLGTDSENKDFLDELIPIAQNTKLFKIFYKHQDSFLRSKDIRQIDEVGQKVFFVFSLIISQKSQQSLPPKRLFIEIKTWLARDLYALLLPPGMKVEFNLDHRFNISFLRILTNSSKKVSELLPEDISEHDRHIIETVRKSPFFDERLYLNLYDDIKGAKISPSYHYALQGFREGRIASFRFDADRYLLENDDVKEAGVNPVYHYTLRGMFEKRSVTSYAPRFNLAMSQKVNRTHPEPLQESISYDDSVRSRYNFVYCAHDDAFKQSGGIQAVIRSELNGCKDYLLIAPTENPEVFLCRSSDKDIPFYTRYNDLRKIRSVKFLVIHSLVNYDFETFFKTNLLRSATKVFYWIHDYSSVCSNFLLLRNNHESCGGPAMDSQSCRICCYSEARRERVTNFGRFMQLAGSKLRVVSPSQTALNIFLRIYPSLSRRSKVRNHFTLGESPRRTHVSFSSRPPRIGFVGSMQAHKGFGSFIKLALMSKGLDCYLFSSKNIGFDKVKYIETDSSKTSTTELLFAHQIDVVIIPSAWDETFCLVAYEALAAGALVYAIEGSGALDELKVHSQSVRMFKTADALIDAVLQLVDLKSRIKLAWTCNSQMTRGYLND